MYGKIFESIYTGTLYGQWEAIITFQQMIVLADEDGVVDYTPPALAAKTSIPLDIIEKGIAALMEPDRYSRSPKEDGRRIVLIDEDRPWGWVIVNYKHYRSLASREEKKKADRERAAEKRRKNNDVADSRAESRGVAEIAHTDTDTDTDSNTPDGVLLTGVSDETPCGDAKGKPDKSPTCPYTKIVDAFNDEAHETWVRATADLLAKSEKANIRSRWQWLMGRPIKDENGNRTRRKFSEDPAAAVEWFRKFFRYAATCEKLTRQNDIGWSLDLAWLMRERNFLATARGTNEGRKTR